jgi:hypothetical protein
MNVRKLGDEVALRNKQATEENYSTNFWNTMIALRLELI